MREEPSQRTEAPVDVSKIQHKAWKIYRMVISFVLIDLILQAARYASFSCYDEFEQAPLGLLLLTCVGLITLCISYICFHKGTEEKRLNYKLFFSCLVLSIGTTVVSNEWSPWRLFPSSINTESNEIWRFIQIKHFEMVLITLKFIQLGGSSRFGIVLYLIPFTYLALRHESFGLSSLEYIAIPVLILATLFKGIPPSQKVRRESLREGRRQLEIDSPELGKSIAGLARESLFETQILLDALPEGVIILDECGSPLQMNDAILKIFECPASEIVAKVFQLTDKDVAVQKSAKQPTLKRSDTVMESYSDFSDAAALDCTIMNSPQLGPQPQGKESPLKQTFLDLPMTRLEFGSSSPSITIRKPPASAFDIGRRSPLQRRASVREEYNSNGLKSIFLEVPVLELPGESSVTSGKINSSPGFSPTGKVTLLNHEAIDVNLQKPPDETTKSRLYDSLSFGLSPRKIAIDPDGKPMNRLSNRKPASDFSLRRCALGNEYRGRYYSDHKPPSYDSQEIIEQIADEQALSMKPHVNDLLERLSSSHIRSTYETVGEAIEHALKKTLKTSLDFSFQRTPEEPKNEGSPECIRSKSDGVSKYFREKKGFVPSSSSIVLNSFLKISSTKVKYLEIKITPFIHAGQKRLIILVRDDTQRDIARRLHTLDKQKASTLASTVHDLRAPLSVIISSLECLNTKLTDSKLISSFVNPATYAAKSLMFLVNDILDIHQISMKKLKLSVQRCDLRQTISAVVDIFKLRAEMKELQLNFKMSEDAPRKIMTDPNRLQQIVINLLSNALKFTEKGSITVEVKDMPEGRVRISVTDTGIGIKQEDLGKLFEKFGRIHSKETDRLNPQGVGLGLNTSNRLSKMLCENEEINGLRVESVFGRGTEFYFVIDDLESSNDTPQSKDSKFELTTAVSPVRVKEIRRTLRSITTLDLSENLKRDESTNNCPSSQIPSHEFDERKNCKCSKVLIVDDNEFNILSALNILRALGIQSIETAKNGKEAVEIIMRKYSQSICCNKFDFILMDCQMPIMDGISACNELRRLTNEKLLPPQRVIGLSGFSSSDFEEKCKKAGMCKVLVKPLTQHNAKALFIH